MEYVRISPGDVPAAPMPLEEAEALGLRYLAAGGAVLPGMLLRWKQSDLFHRCIEDDAAPDQGWWPDLRDGATRGAVLEFIRERWGCPSAHVAPGLGAILQTATPNGVRLALTWDVNGLRCVAGPVGCTAMSEPEVFVIAVEASVRLCEPPVADLACRPRSQP